MTRGRWLLIAIGVCIVIMGLIRFSPVNALNEHRVPDLGQPSKEVATIDNIGGYYTSRSFDAFPGEVMREINDIILQSPRTVVLAGSVSSGMVSYVTRSRIFGFPDVTTVKSELTPEGAHLWLYGRLSIGVSDLGTNKRRILGWLQQMQTR